MPSSIPVDTTLGALLIGMAFSLTLYGATCMQVYSYFSRHSENDQPFLKCFVAALLSFETLQMSFFIHGYYTLGITNFGDLVSDPTVPLSLRAQVPMGGLVEYAIHLFYAWRIYQFSRGQAYIPCIIVITSFCRLALGTALFVQSVRYPNFLKEQEQRMIVIPGLSFKLACDLTITASMVYYLHTRCTRVKQTIDAITALVLYSITTGALALVLSILCLAAYVRWPHTAISASFFYTGTCIYVCAFMAQLNSRGRIRTKLAAEVENGIVINPAVFIPGPNPSRDSTQGGTGPVIDVVSGFADQNTVETSWQNNLDHVEHESTFPRAV